jgi:hypothetical protein
MDRFFLAVMVSGLLLAAVAMSLFVATSGGERTASVMSLPPVPSTTTGEVRPPRRGAADEGPLITPPNDPKR